MRMAVLLFLIVSLNAKASMWDAYAERIHQRGCQGVAIFETGGKIWGSKDLSLQANEATIYFGFFNNPQNALGHDLPVSGFRYKIKTATPNTINAVKGPVHVTVRKTIQTGIVCVIDQKFDPVKVNDEVDELQEELIDSGH